MSDFSSRLMAAHVTNERFDLIVHGFDVLGQYFRVGKHIVANFAFLLRIPTHLSAIVLMVGDAMHTEL